MCQEGGTLPITHAQLGGGLNTPPEVAVFHSCSDNCSATFLKILGSGHQRSGQQVRSSDPNSEKNTIASRPQ